MRSKEQPVGSCAGRSILTQILPDHPQSRHRLPPIEFVKHITLDYGPCAGVFQLTPRIRHAYGQQPAPYTGHRYLGPTQFSGSTRLTSTICTRAPARLLRRSHHRRHGSQPGLYCRIHQPWNLSTSIRMVRPPWTDQRTRGEDQRGHMELEQGRSAYWASLGMNIHLGSYCLKVLRTHSALPHEIPTLWQPSGAPPAWQRATLTNT